MNNRVMYQVKIGIRIEAKDENGNQIIYRGCANFDTLWQAQKFVENSKAKPFVTFVDEPIGIHINEDDGMDYYEVNHAGRFGR